MKDSWITSIELNERMQRRTKNLNNIKIEFHRKKILSRSEQSLLDMHHHFIGTRDVFDRRFTVIYHIMLFFEYSLARFGRFSVSLSFLFRSILFIQNQMRCQLLGIPLVIFFSQEFNSRFVYAPISIFYSYMCGRAEGRMCVEGLYAVASEHKIHKYDDRLINCQKSSK